MEAGEVVENTRNMLTAFFNGTDSDRLCFSYNSTDALNLIIFGMLKPGDHAVSTTIEHNSVLRPLYHLSQEGVDVDLVPFDGAGFVDPGEIRKRFRPTTRLVIVNHASNVIGTLQPVGEIGRLCREAGIPFAIDASQSAGKVPVDMDGWFLEAHVKLRPVEFASSGVFLAGAAHYPKLLDETIVQAQAAASRAATVLSRETLSAGGAVAHIDPQLCVGCLTCVRICPFGVPQIIPEEVGVGGVIGAAYIEPSACQGCGTCVGECPAYAIELLHYRHDQIECAVCSLLNQASIEG